MYSSYGPPLSAAQPAFAGFTANTNQFLFSYLHRAQYPGTDQKGTLGVNYFSAETAIASGSKTVGVALLHQGANDGATGRSTNALSISYSRYNSERTWYRAGIEPCLLDDGIHSRADVSLGLGISRAGALNKNKYDLRGSRYDNYISFSLHNALGSLPDTRYAQLSGLGCIFLHLDFDLCPFVNVIYSDKLSYEGGAALLFHTKSKYYDEVKLGLQYRSGGYISPVFSMLVPTPYLAPFREFRLYAAYDIPVADAQPAAFRNAIEMGISVGLFTGRGVIWCQKPGQPAYANANPNVSSL